MSGFPIVDLVIGIFFVYFMLSIIASSAVEITLTILKARSKLMKTWLLEIFDKKFHSNGDPNMSLGQAIMDHGSVTGLSKKGKAPAYIKAKDFAAALLEKISFDPANPTQVVKNIDGYIDAIENTELLPTDMKRVLLGYAHEIQNRAEEGITKTISGLERFSSKIESWYDSSMERLTGELKRRYSVPLTAVVAIILTISLNADSIALARYLYSNPEIRTKLATEAYSASGDSALVNKVATLKSGGDSTQSAATVEEIKQKITELRESKRKMSEELPLTWKGGEFTRDGRFSIYLLFAKIAGLLATILAIMMGAPFWFDLMNKVSNLRGTGNKPVAKTSSNEDE